MIAARPRLTNSTIYNTTEKNNCNLSTSNNPKNNGKEATETNTNMVEALNSVCY